MQDAYYFMNTHLPEQISVILHVNTSQCSTEGGGGGRLKIGDSWRDLLTKPLDILCFRSLIFLAILDLACGWVYQISSKGRK
jgi:hypothetical protein